MAEVLPSSPQYVGGGGGGGARGRGRVGEDENHSSSNSSNLLAIDPPRSSRPTPRVSRVFSRSPRRNPFDEEKISMAVRGNANGRTSASASSSSSSSSVLFNICKGDTTAGAEDDEEEEEQQQQRSHSMNPSEENNGNSNVNEGEQQPWILALLLATFRRSLVACKPARGGDERSNMEISWPTNVQHVAHVTFDRFNGFLGLPVEFEMEIPRRVPSASASVFGVSAESMQLSYDSRGNSVPTILLLMQQRLYSQGGLKAEGIFRINAENSQEENVRDQLNKGVVPDDIDVHCLAGLIKAWFRELPTGVLDTLTPEQVLQCNEEKDYVELVKLLPPTQVALLNWSVNLMTDVVQEEECNKMNARNIAMVFAPNMTQMSDPLNALMHAVRVMNFLQTLILKTLREREEAAGKWTLYCSDSNDEDDYNSNPQTSNGFKAKETSDEEDKTSQSDEYLIDGYCLSSGERDLSDEEEELTTVYTEEGFMGQVDEKELSDDGSSRDSLFDIYDSREVLNELRECREQGIVERDDNLQQLANRNHMLVLQGSETRASTSQEDIFLLTGIQVDKKKMIVDEIMKGDSKENSQHLIQMIQAAVKTRGSVVNSIDQQIERVEAW